MKPLIGVSCNFNESKPGLGQCTVPASYVDAVQAAGGVPIIVPQVHEREDALAILDKLDAMIFTGGADIRPERYGEEQHPKTKLVAERRETSDFMFAKAAIERDMPVMAICYGCQVLDVAFGGTLYQDVPDQLKTDIKHSAEGGTYPRHMVCIEPGTKLAGILQVEEILANSSHHQAVKAVTEPVIISARAEDGVIEAIESTAHRHILGIQWHPEKLIDEEKHLALFRALVQEASSR
ncbi:MAG: gamma-glutamyl-gamma-aminobutyrate hydrolase family protein [Planctomycetes bacterium]|nr:gamma-glutamyl-gamma-aminobutyrate hydrolase family protein [Planctomycetota bacterium]